VFRDYFKACYGPTIPVYRGIAEDTERVAALDRDLAGLARRFDTGSDTTVLDWEYLLLPPASRPTRDIDMGADERCPPMTAAGPAGLDFER
jgi:hypothetical protein